MLEPHVKSRSQGRRHARSIRNQSHRNSGPRRTETGPSLRSLAAIERTNERTNFLCHARFRMPIGDHETTCPAVMLVMLVMSVNRSPQGRGVLDRSGNDSQDDLNAPAIRGDIWTPGRAASTRGGASNRRELSTKKPVTANGTMERWNDGTIKPSIGHLPLQIVESNGKWKHRADAVTRIRKSDEAGIEYKASAASRDIIPNQVVRESVPAESPRLPWVPPRPRAVPSRASAASPCFSA